MSARVGRRRRWRERKEREREKQEEEEEEGEEGEIASCFWKCLTDEVSWIYRTTTW